MEKNAEQKEQELVRKRLMRLMNKACADYGLITDGDHLLVGLSGGKDSLALVDLLAERQKIIKPRFRISAVHVQVDNIGYRSEVSYLEAFCKERGVPFQVVRTCYEEEKWKKEEGRQGEEQMEHPEKSYRARIQKNHCFLCSWYRRKALFSAAAQLGCNKIALGHHKDDIVETLLMNLVYQGHFGTIPPLLKMEKFQMQMVRPLCLIEEKDIARYAELVGYEKQKRLCPYEHESTRKDIKELLQSLEQYNPDVRSSLWGAMENIKTDYLPKTRKTK